MRLFDSHAHLDFPQFREDRGRILEAMRDQHVAALNVGADLGSSRASLALAASHEHIGAACGVHPHDAKDYTPDAEAELAHLLNEGAVAVGECGLDFYRDRSPRDQQERAFRAQLRMAGRLELPVILHQRDAWGTFVRVLREEGPPRGVVHAFSGDTENARQVVAMGLHLGIGGPLTYARNHALRDAVRAVPVERLLVETDCPYLPPQPFRGKRNDPLKVRLVVQALADLLGMRSEKLAEITWNNACDLFGVHPTF